MPDPIHTSCPWPRAAAPPQLVPGVVHVWCISLDLPEPTIGDLRAILPADEEARAVCYLFDKHRRRFIACRGQVRRILAGYLGADPSKIDFRHGAKGKPFLAAPWSDSQVQFNVSNSHEDRKSVV